jgi:hypothetical protein
MVNHQQTSQILCLPSSHPKHTPQRALARVAVRLTDPRHTYPTSNRTRRLGYGCGSRCDADLKLSPAIPLVAPIGAGFGGDKIQTETLPTRDVPCYRTAILCRDRSFRFYNGHTAPTLFCPSI